MFIHGLWWVEQWHKAHKPFYQYADDSPEGQVGSVIYAITTGVFPAVGISLGTYGGIQQATMGLERYVENRVYQGHFWAFDMKSHRFTFSRSASRRMLLKGAAKVGARAIPYAGWALFALDMWHVGKWIGEKTNPFDS